MEFLNGHPFWYRFDNMPGSSEDAAIFVKYSLKLHTFFLSHEDFYKWFTEFREICRKKRKAFSIFEMIIDGYPTAFYADIEGLSPLSAHADELLEIRHTMKKIFRAKYSEMGGNAGRLVFMEDHRVSKGFHKTSFQVIGPSEMFLDVKRHGSMHNYAKRLNGILTPAILQMNMNIDFHNKNRTTNNMLDMAVYNHKRGMRTWGSAKSSESGGFRLCEECRFLDFRSCFINLNIPLDELDRHTFIECTPPSDEATSVVKRNKGVSRETTTKSSVCDKTLTPERQATLERIEKLLTQDYNHKLTSVQFDKVFMSRDQYRIDGSRDCPICDVVHDSNGAYVTDLENGQYQYKCLTPSPLSSHSKTIGTHTNRVASDGGSKEYVQSLIGIPERCVMLCASMGSGKTYAIIEYIRSLPPTESVAWMVPRTAMASCIMGRLIDLGFKSYKETIHHKRLVIEYESVYKIDYPHGNIVLDECRSLLKSAVARKTNGDNLLKNLDTLISLCKQSTKTFLVDADLYYDGACESLCEEVFAPEDVFRINHTGGTTSLKHIFVYREDFYSKLYASIEKGERVVVTCGASVDLKEIAVGASRVIEKKHMIQSGKYIDFPKVSIAVSEKLFGKNVFPDTPKNEANEARISDISDKIEEENLIDRYIYESTSEVRYAVARVLRANPFRNDDNLAHFVAQTINESDDVPYVQYGEYMDPVDLAEIVFSKFSALHSHVTLEQVRSAIRDMDVLTCDRYIRCDKFNIDLKKIRTSDKVGAYHAECSIKGELEDVSVHWDRYQVILYTSCITVSVDYQGAIDRVFCLPSIWSATSREGEQMNNRTRKNISGEVIMCLHGDQCTPSDVGFYKVFGEKLSAIITMAKYAGDAKTEYDSVLTNTVLKKGFGYKASFVPTLATKLHAWDLVEAQEKTANWYGTFLRILKDRGHTWDWREIENSAQEKQSELVEKNHLIQLGKRLRVQEAERVKNAIETRKHIMSLTDMDQRKEARGSLTDTKKKLDAERAENVANKKSSRQAILAKSEFCSQATKRKQHISKKLCDDLGSIDVKDITTKALKDALGKKIQGSAVPIDHLTLRKAAVHKYFTEKLSGKQVLFFEKHKRAIFNRAMHSTYSLPVRQRIHSIQIETGMSLEFVPLDAKLVQILEEITKNLGLSSFQDTSAFDWHQIFKGSQFGAIETDVMTLDEMTMRSSKDKNSRLLANMTDEGRSKTILSRMRHYFKVLLELNIRRKQLTRRVDGVQTKKTVFFIEDMVSSITSLEHRICDQRWFMGVCDAYDMHILDKFQTIHRERAHMHSLDACLFPFMDSCDSRV